MKGSVLFAPDFDRIAVVKVREMLDRGVICRASVTLKPEKVVTKAIDEDENSPDQAEEDSDDGWNSDSDEEEDSEEDYEEFDDEDDELWEDEDEIVDEETEEPTASTSYLPSEYGSPLLITK